MNILISAENKAKLGDFDLADVRDEGDSLTLCDGWGSPAYVSPERLLYGGEDYRDWTEVYVRGLADICQGLAAEFDVVCEMTAGLPHLWKGELPRV